MNNHYIPQLLLKQFAFAGKANVYDVAAASWACKKLKHVFAEQDLFEPELEKQFAVKLEGPFADLLNHKLLSGKEIAIDRRENLLIRKFLMVHALRAPIHNISWDEQLERTGTQNHPTVRAIEFLTRHNPELKEEFEQIIPTGATYISNLKKVMAIDSMEQMADPDINFGDSVILEGAARYAMASAIAFWDSSECGQEFLLPKLPGISQMDYKGIFYKRMIIRGRRFEMEKKGMPDHIIKELRRLEYGSCIYCDNFSVFPISPTRVLICFSPYFRAFFPTVNVVAGEVVPPFLDKELFDSHFYEPMRMELFEPCQSYGNQYYRYSVKELTEKEVMSVNAMMLNMENEEFVFHDFNRIRDSFWYYDKKAKFADGKKHDFSRWEC